FQGDSIMRSLLHRLALWLARKTAPAAGRHGLGDRPAFLDAYRRLRNPSAQDLLAELKDTAYARGGLKASVCAPVPPRLYVSTRPGEPAPRCLTRALSAPERRELLAGSAGASPSLGARLKSAEMVEEVLDHPLLTLLRAVNSTHNAHDLWELTTPYQQAPGSAYWVLSLG